MSRGTAGVPAPQPGHGHSEEMRRRAGPETKAERLERQTQELELQLDRRTADYRRIFENAHDAILVLDREDGTVLDANQRACEIYGYEHSQLIGRSLRPISKNVEIGDAHRGWLAESPEGNAFESVQYHHDGSEITLEVNASLIEYEGRPAILSINRDVTERKRAEAELAQQRARLEELLRQRTVALRKLKENAAELEARNAEMGRFTYTLSHDLKTPLITIRGFLGLLRKDLETGNVEATRRDMERIHDAAGNMYRLLDELLALSRIGRVVNPPEEVSLADLAREAAATQGAHLVERGVEVAIDPALPVVRGDCVRLLEVLVSLLDNAVKFLGDAAPPRIEVGQRRQDGETVVLVRDNGIGIDPRYHQKVFDLFDRLDPSVEGTGVGLTLVQRIIELHGGRIWVESEGSGLGSTFCFTLPQGSQEAGES